MSMRDFECQRADRVGPTVRELVMQIVKDKTPRERRAGDGGRKI